MFKKLNPNHKRLGVLLLVLAFLIGFNVFSAQNAQDVDDVPLAKIMSTIKAKNASKSIDEVVVEDARRSVTISFEDEDKPWIVSSYPTDYGTVILDAAADNDVEVNVQNDFNPRQTLTSVLISLLPIILIIGILIWVIRGTMGGKSTDKPISEAPETRFKDLAGIDEAVEDLGEITDFLKNTNRFEAIGAVAPKGALLFGPPGTGKTELARAVAGEAGVPFIHTTGSSFQEMFVGLGARRVRNLFKEARKHESCVIFIDEIDSVGGNRNGGGDGPDAREHGRTINALLSEMDGFEKTNIIVLGATNNPDSLDPALTRAGRFDRKITVGLPDWKGRMGILAIHSEGKPLDENVDLETLAKSTVGLSGAELANLVNEALINAVRSERTAASQEDFMEALSIVTLGRARTSAVLTDSDKEVIAAHEAGHAVVGLAEAALEDPNFVTITPRGFSGGHTKLPESENQFQTESYLKARLSMIFGGYVAERYKFGEISQGPGHDLAAATDLATQMITKMGMGSILSVLTDQDLSINSSLRLKAQDEIDHLLSASKKRSEDIFSTSHWLWAFEEIRTQLLERESLDKDELLAIKDEALKRSDGS